MWTHPPTKFNPEVSIILAGRPFEEGEDVMERARVLLIQCDHGASSCRVDAGKGPGPGQSGCPLAETKAEELLKVQGSPKSQTERLIDLRSQPARTEELHHWELLTDTTAFTWT